MDAAVTSQRDGDDWRLVIAAWLQSLRGRISVADAERHDSHDVAIGRAPDDRWLEVHWDGQLRNHGAQYVNGCDEKLSARDVREVMVLLRVMAHVDPYGSLGRLQRAVGFEVPAWMDVVTEKLQCQFVFNLDKRTDFTKDCWRSVLEGLLNAKEPSRPFVQLYKMLSAQLHPATEGRGPLKIPIHIRFSPSARDMRVLDQADLLGQFEGLVLTLLDDTRSLSGDLIPVQLCLESVELDLRDFTIGSAVFRGILGVLKTGVCVKSITLPQVDDGVDLYEVALRVSWASLSCSLCSVDFVSGYDARSIQPVRRVVVPKVYVASPLLFEPFFSALHHGHGIESLRVELFLEWHRRAGAAFWLWLAYGLRRSDSSSTVETLDIDRMALTDDIVPSMTRVLIARDPTSALWGAMPQSRSEGRDIDGLNQVVIQVRATLKQLSINSSDRVIMPCAWPGIIVQEDPAYDRVRVLVPGFGFCEVDRFSTSVIEAMVSSDPNSRTTQPSKSISTLLLGCHGVQNSMNWRFDRLQDILINFVALFGQEVNHLSLRCSILDDRTVRECVTRCRSVESLRVSGGWYDSMEWLARLYVTGYRISSLELHDMSLDTHHLVQILNCILGAGPIRNALSRLRICAQRNPLTMASTADLLQCVVEDVTSLSHLFVYYGRPQVYKEMPPDDEQPVKIEYTDVHPLSVKLAFVSVADTIGSAGRTLNPDTMTLIFGYAGLRPKRIVVVSDGA